MSCPYVHSGSDAPCLIFSQYRYKNLESFVLGETVSSSLVKQLLLNDVACRRFDPSSKTLWINPEACLGCLSCVFSCPGGYISITGSGVPHASCGDSNSVSKTYLGSDGQSAVYWNDKDKLPVPSVGEWQSFEDYIGVKETLHIAPWVASLMRFVGTDSASVATEVPLTIKNRDRNGRLDVCLIDDGYLMIFETKTTLKDTLSDGRYLSQMLSYREEASKLTGLPKTLDIMMFYVIGGKETDLFPPSDNRCTGLIGNSTSIFYDGLRRYGFKAISALGLLSAVMLSLRLGRENFFLLMRLFKESPHFVGLVSNNFVVFDEGGYSFFPIQEALKKPPFRRKSPAK